MRGGIATLALPASRRSLNRIIAAALAVAVIGAVLWQVSRARCVTLAGSVTCRVETAKPMVALTFDDGPTPIGVESATEILDRFGASATFFLTGNEAERRPQLVRALLARGHEIGNHSYSHRQMVARSQAFYDREIARTDAVFRQAGAPETRYLRPPYGKKLIGLPRAVERHGHRMITWDVEDPPAAASPRDYANGIVENARPGSIILMHVMYSSNRTAREALPLVLQGLHAKGLQVVTVGRLLEEEGRR